MKLQNQAIAKLRKQNKKPTDEVDINPTSVGFLFLYPIQFCLTREGLELLVWVQPTYSWVHHCGKHLTQ